MGKHDRAHHYFDGLLAPSRIDKIFRKRKFDDAPDELEMQLKMDDFESRAIEKAREKAYREMTLDKTHGRYDSDAIVFGEDA